MLAARPSQVSQSRNAMGSMYVPGPKCRKTQELCIRSNIIGRMVEIGFAIEKPSCVDHSCRRLRRRDFTQGIVL